MGQNSLTLIDPKANLLSAQFGKDIYAKIDGFQLNHLKDNSTFKEKKNASFEQINPFIKFICGESFKTGNDITLTLYKGEILDITCSDGIQLEKHLMFEQKLHNFLQ